MVGLANPRASEEKGLSLAFCGVPRASSDPPEKGEKGRKRVKKTDFQQGRPDTR